MMKPQSKPTAPNVGEVHRTSRIKLANAWLPCPQPSWGDQMALNRQLLMGPVPLTKCRNYIYSCHIWHTAACSAPSARLLSRCGRCSQCNFQLLTRDELAGTAPARLSARAPPTRSCRYACHGMHLILRVAPVTPPDAVVAGARADGAHHAPGGAAATAGPGFWRPPVVPHLALRRPQAPGLLCRGAVQVFNLSVNGTAVSQSPFADACLYVANMWTVKTPPCLAHYIIAGCMAPHPERLPDQRQLLLLSAGHHSAQQVVLQALRLLGRGCASGGRRVPGLPNGTSAACR